MPKILKRSHALRWLYGIISTGLALSALPSLLLCFRRECRMRLRERWGWHSKVFKAALGRKVERRIWIHAVSVGEVHVALHLIDALHKQEPRTAFVLTTVTREGRMLAGRCARSNIHISYAPIDFPGAVRRSFRTFAPDLLLLVEIEIWPNQLWEASHLGVPVAVVNGRLPRGDLKKYRLVSWFMRDIFGLLSLVCAQTSEDAEAFRDLGVAHDRIHLTGSMKMDAALEKAGRPPESGFPWDVISQRTIVIGGSTHAGEEKILFDIAARVRSEFAGFLLVVAPRHISRAEELIGAAGETGMPALRWSQILTQGHGTGEDFPVLVIDTIGDLARFYSLARAVFVGKSLTARGGQNPMEPAAVGRAVIFGPFMENFSTVVRLFLQSRAALQVANAEELEAAILGLLRDPEAADALGRSAREVVSAHAGATGRTLRLLGGLPHWRGGNALS